MGHRTCVQDGKGLVPSQCALYFMMFIVGSTRMETCDASHIYYRRVIFRSRREPVQHNPSALQPSVMWWPEKSTGHDT
jgi:hypothetical protein